MRCLLREAMHEGAFGFSTTLRRGAPAPWWMPTHTFEGGKDHEVRTDV
jgi:hypothetical protein